MAFATNPIGANSYCITTTQGTTTEIVLQEIIRIIQTDAALEPPRHGWEFINVEYDKPFTATRLNYRFRSVAWFRSLCENGSYKYAVICTIDDARMCMMKATAYSEDMSTVVPLLPHPVVTRGASPSRGMWNRNAGWIYNEMTIDTRDRFDFLLFIHPRWLAFTTVPYSTKERTNYGTYEHCSYSAFGFFGLFETYSCYPHINSVFIHGPMAINGEINTSNDSLLRMWQPNGVVIDNPVKYTSGMSGIKLINSGELPSNNGSDYGGLSYCSSSLPTNGVSMLDMYDSNSGNGATLTNMKKVGSVHGLKSIKYNSLQRAFSKIWVNANDNGMLDKDESEKLHLVIPCYLEGAGMSGEEQTNRLRYATVLLPA